MAVKSVLFNPSNYNSFLSDEKTKEKMLRTIEYFEEKGLKQLREDDTLNRWQSDWMIYQKKHEIFSTMLTCKGYGKEDSRFDLSRICEMSEVLAFYGEGYQYPFQVSILGVGPIWMGNNEKQKRELAEQLEEGHIFAFGMSEKAHGADLYSNKCNLTPVGEDMYVANGNKYYIGNAHIASKVTTLGKNIETNEWVYWVVDSRHRNYKYVKDIVLPSIGTARVGEYEMVEYPITNEDILKTGDQAFADGLATVNIGKFQLGFAAAGIASHALFEAITHANRRILYGQKVTVFPHIKAFLNEAVARANAMKLYALRSLDYFRMMTEDDRRYLLFNPVQKMKVTTEGSDVIRLIMDVVCAKGYENENYISEAYTNMDYLFRLEGTAHVNMALVLKFMQNYLFDNTSYPEIGRVDIAKDDVNIFNQRLGGLSKVGFPRYDAVYENVDIQNIKIFKNQIDTFRDLLSNAAPDVSLHKNMDYMLNIGEIFTMIVYAQLVLEGALLNDLDERMINQIFGYFIKDMNGYALNQLNNQNNSEEQEKYLTKIVLIKPSVDKEVDQVFWEEFVEPLDGAYIMKDSVIGDE